jgi:hypothetical protein
MSFFRFINRFRLYNIIVKDDESIVVACFFCCIDSMICVKMKNHSKCAECVHRERSCVDASWESLNRIREKLEFDLNLAKEEFFKTLAKIVKLRKTLKHTKSKVAKKILCLTRELTNDYESVFDENSNSSILFVDLSSDFWQFITFFSVETLSTSSDNFCVRVLTSVSLH